MFKLQFYSQTSSAQPTTPSSYQFNARVFTSTTLTSPTATLAWPVSNSNSLVQSGTTLQRGGSFASAASLDAAFPQGSYNFSVQSADLGGGVAQTGSLTMPASYYALSVPYFTNFASLQNINASQTTTFAWNTFTTNPSAALSQIFLVIRDNTQSTVVVNQFFASASTASYDVTGSTLIAGDNYTATLYFSSRDSFPGAWSAGASGLVAFDQVTSMSFTAIPEPATSAAIMGGVLGLVIVGRRSRRRSDRIS